MKAIGTYMMAEEYDSLAVAGSGIGATAAKVTFGPRAYWIRMRKGGHILGNVKYFKRWKGYVFQPEEMTEFSADCLRALSEFMISLNDRKC